MKVLIVGAPSSIHTGRFASLLAEFGNEVRVFNCEISEAVDEHLGAIPVYLWQPVRQRRDDPARLSWAKRPWLAKIVAPGEGGSGFVRQCERRYQKWLRRNRNTPILSLIIGEDEPAVDGLLRTVDEWRPDVIISLKMQNEGYVTAAAKRMAGDQFPPWLHFNWGTDIAYFGVDPYHTPEHLPKIRDVLARCDMHIADCQRDVRLARELGFSGVSLGSCLATGGFDVAQMADIRARATTPKRTILMKGRNWPTRESGKMPISVGLKAIEALEKARDTLIEKGLSVRIILATPDVAEAAEGLRNKGVDVEVLGRMPYERLLAEFANARFTLSSTLVDGTPLFLAETMILGSVPLHSGLESIREWVTHGDNGLLFEPEDVDDIAAQIERAATDDAFVARASARNLEIATERMDRQVIGPWFSRRLTEALAECSADSERREAGR